MFQDEDRTYGGNDLFIDLIPKTSWFKNIRSCFSKKDWDIIRKYIYERVDYKCECCSKNCFESNDLEAHERWSYDIDTETQKIMRIIALCKKCHLATHYGYCQVIGLTNVINKHIKEVKNINDEQLNNHINEAFNLWNMRNMYNWNLDLSMIENAGFKIKK